jgi:hypothetical protein
LVTLYKDDILPFFLLVRLFDTLEWRGVAVGGRISAEMVSIETLQRTLD